MSFKINNLTLFQSMQQMQKSIPKQSQFKEYLSNEINDKQLKISKHANERLNQRHITISEADWSLIENKIYEASQMGVKDSLVLVNEAALIINAQNNTVITAMDREEAKTQIFTNINGTIIMD
ncbi:TIGR02530 family flagellar biosynthesis protein [Bacillus sp. J37]|uniref:TIGR02530 family flagellar biosynthesis protein n=1 Tax=Bacillus sp. J37 TaxID=935837 RepID=UPI0004BBCD3E|nr:TIGR02530 family flagellar biosynthesis protein [Bacillus sp. J37]